MHALILANGEHPPVELIRLLRQEADLFIVTDGAANALLTHGEIADVVLGDLDSLLPHVAEQLPEGSTLPLLDQESSDLDKALGYAVDRGATRATVLGFGGGRLDHTFTAASLLLKYADSLDVELRDASTRIRLVRGEAVIEGSPGDTISLILFEPAEGVTLEGVEWPLRAETLLPGSRGVSNRLVADRATLRIRSGWSLVCHLHNLTAGQSV
jgi:thiamine pyrophosphokinase